MKDKPLTSGRTSNGTTGKVTIAPVYFIFHLTLPQRCMVEKPRILHNRPSHSDPVVKIKQINQFNTI